MICLNIQQRLCLINTPKDLLPLDAIGLHVKGTHVAFGYSHVILPCDPVM